MARRSRENLKVIRFEGELLPNWAQLLDLASRMCAVPEETRRWFSALTQSNGVEDGRTVIGHCELLRGELLRWREKVLSELEIEGARWSAVKTPSGPLGQRALPLQVYGAWIYALETMIQQARERKTCAWFVEGAEDAGGEFGDGGEITLRRV
jgi:hypothetical protein